MGENKKEQITKVEIPVVLSELWDEFIRECDRRNLTTSIAFHEAISNWIAIRNRLK